MKNIAYTPAAIFYAAVLMTFACPPEALCQAAPPNGQGGPKRAEVPTLTVTGHGTAHARPDRAMVRLGVEAQADTAKAAQDSVSNSMQKIIQELEKMGVPKRSIRTASINLDPIYSAQKPGQESEPPRVLGYRASNTIQVEVTDLKLLGEVIDAATSAGANRLQGVSFELENDGRYRADALRDAAFEAKAAAQTLAKALDLKLGPVRKVDQVSVNTPRPMEYFGRAARLAVAATPVEPGEMTIEASVTVAYQIEF